MIYRDQPERNATAGGAFTFRQTMRAMVGPLITRSVAKGDGAKDERGWIGPAALVCPLVNPNVMYSTPAPRWAPQPRGAAETGALVPAAGRARSLLARQPMRARHADDTPTLDGALLERE